MSNFTHIDTSGQPNMVDVSDKHITTRTAKARSTMVLTPEVVKALKTTDFKTKKGPVFQTAIIAGNMAVKRTSDLIPLCHPLLISKCSVGIAFNEKDELVIDCFVKISGKTGVEMEALTGCSVAALTVYDMIKSFSHNIIIKETKLIEKTGGKSDYNAE